MATREENIKALADSLVKLSAGVTLSDAVDSELGVGQGTAATPKAVKIAYDYTTDVAQSVLEAAKNATEGSDNVTDLREPLLADVYHEIGTWWISLDNSIPVGGLPHLGHLCARDTYGEFWTWCETNKTVVSDEEWLVYADSHNGCCPYYSYGDGSTTFRTPKYDQSFLKILATMGGTGEMQEAGLPYFGGSIQGVVTDGGYGTGIFNFQQTTIENLSVVASGAKSAGTFTLTPPSVYGNSDTVTPQNFGIIVGVYAVGAVSAPIGETDAASLLNGISVLESRTGALESGSGFSEAGRQAIIGWGMPGGTQNKVDIAISRSGVTYVAPNHGYIYVDVELPAGAENVWFQLENYSGGVYTYEANTGSLHKRAKLFVPIAKGQTARFQYGTIDSVKSAFFVPAIGV